MAESSANWQKYETKSSKKKSAKSVNVNGQGDSKATAKQNGSVNFNNNIDRNSSIPLSNTMFDDFIEGGDGAKKSGTKNGKVGGRGRQGTSYISGEDLVKNGSVKSKFGETISFFTTTASETASKWAGTKKPVPKKSTPEVKSLSYSINFSALKAEPIKAEIESLADVDQVKRCLSLAVFLNIQRPHQDIAGWETKSFESSEPLANLPKNVEKVLQHFIQSLPDSAVGTSFELVLAELVSKSHTQATTWGYKVMLQLLGRIFPETAVLQHHKSLSRLFANTIATKINVVIWALSQPIMTDPVIGLRIWSKILLPHISNKSLAPAVCVLLDRLMSIDELVLGNQTLAHVDYFHLLDYTFPQSGMHNLIDQKTHKTLMTYYPKLKMMASINSRAVEFFSSFLMRYNENQCPEMLDELVHCLALCLRSNSKCYEMWFQMLPNYSEQTRHFLVDLMARWEEVPEVPRKELNKFIDRVQKYLDKNPTDDGLADTLKQFKEQLYGKPRKRVTFGSKSKEASGKSSGRGLFFKLFWLLVLITLCAFVEYKIRGRDSVAKNAFEASANNMRQLHDWMIKSYPSEAKYVKDSANRVIAKVKPQIFNAYNVAYNYIAKGLDWLYKDGPLRMFRYAERDILPAVNKFYKRNMEKRVATLSRNIGEALDSVMSYINLELLRPYLK